MTSNRSFRYSGYRFPSEIISYAIWAYHRFCLSFRDVEDLLAERGIIVSYETIRLWCQKFGADYVHKLKRRQGRLGDHSHLDEVFLRICDVAHTTERYANNRMEASHQPTRQRERQMRRFKSVRQAQRFLSLHGVVHNLFRLGRHLIRPDNYRFLRSRSFSIWRTMTAD